MMRASYSQRRYLLRCCWAEFFSSRRPVTDFNAMTQTVLLLIPLALAISLPITALLMRLGRRLGVMDTPGTAGHEKQLRNIPNIGGIAIYLGIATPLLAGIIALLIIDAEWLTARIPQIEPHLERLLYGDDDTASSLAAACALLACITALHVIGVIDDRKPLGPVVKMLVQFAAAAVLVNWFDVRLFTLFGEIPSILITVLWIVGITNAINFIDNMDGLCGGVTVVAATLFMIAALVNAQWFIAATLALMIGATLGFLVFNFPPAKIFMGDGGSLVLGFLLGVLTARTTYYHPNLGGGWYAVFMPVVVLAVPLYDFVTVTLIRLRQGRSPFVGDQQHFSHRLVQRGLSRRAAVIVIWAMTAVTGIGGISLGRLEGWQAILVGVQTVFMLVVVALLEHATRAKQTGGASP